MPWWLYDTVVFLGTNKLFFHHLEPLLINLFTSLFNTSAQCFDRKVLLSECITIKGLTTWSKHLIITVLVPFSTQVYQ